MSDRLAEIREKLGPPDYDGLWIWGDDMLWLCDEVDAVNTRADAAEYQLRELLAVLNRDGGHFQVDNGTEAAVKRGLELHYEYLRKAAEFDDETRDRLHAEARTRRETAKAHREAQP